MSDYFTEVNRNTFSISFKSKVDDNKFFKYVEKNFNKWGMVDIDYDKKEKTIIGKSPAIALSFWNKFPVKLNKVGLKSIIISKGDEKNSFLINVNTNEMFGNSHTIRFPTYFSKEINSKFARVIINKQANKDSENSDTKGSNNRKKISKSKKLTADEKIANVKKKNPSKMIWWISGAVGFVVLLMVIGSGSNNSSKLVSPMGKTTYEVAECLGFLTEKNRVEGGLGNGQIQFIKMHKKFLSRIEVVMNKVKNEPWANNHRIEDIKNLMSNYNNTDKELYYGLAVGQNIYYKLNTTQRGVTTLACSVIN